ncbi:hypothetical protein J8L98_14040 [Pseudoalteromonas sp. MMG013]|uniref:hypothetical protein n=1 Tax=Pseudoalteromonas sp. MMG013 TaxID=2822687 RepID=UPI001B38B6EB|nr:hypothetical protein [Pseudoalteromonas sp. MMG013]MBQ4862803.1 hypothetical protein [Pseudoalteromonas sp. MMG013]
MNIPLPSNLFAILIFSTCLFVPQTSSAHLMVAQNGTLNFNNAGAYMVLSLPISAFDGLDSDKDGKVTLIEFNNHRSSLIAQIKNAIFTMAHTQKILLHNIVLTPQRPHKYQNNSDLVEITDIIIMGMFPVTYQKNTLQFHNLLYGKTAQEKLITLSVTKNHTTKLNQFDLSMTQPFWDL